MADKNSDVEPEVVDVEALPTVETFDVDDEDYNDADVPELGDELDADYDEYTYEKDVMGGEEL